MKTQSVLIIGSGVAGLSCALRLPSHVEVTIVTKAEASESNSRYAQGGIAAVWGEDDDIASHVNDTLVAGAGLCRREVVEQVIKEGPIRVQDLISLGVEFTKSANGGEEYDLHREGGHSTRRILHSADLTGEELIRTLMLAVRSRENVVIHERAVAIDLITERWVARREGAIPPARDRVRGAYVLHKASNEVRTHCADVVVLAAGGAGKVYLYTTNPNVATGAGMAMAYRAGATCANMEFVQFHPTCLWHPKEHSFLISEALRGEGGKLIRPDGSRFMADYDEREELASRDIVARAIDSEMKRFGFESVFLDMRHFSREECAKNFPNIDAKLLSLGIDMAESPIPVVPAAHYFCGGVQTDVQGESSIENLFAIGETSCTGLHGANRLASNSLLEAVVFAERAATEITNRLDSLGPTISLPKWNVASAVNSDEMVVVTQTWEEIRRFMWNYVGIVRTYRRLKRARRRIQLVQEEINTYYWDFRVTSDLIELRNIATVAEMVVDCALQRRESRGLHSIRDFPERDDRFLADTIIKRRT